MSSSVVKTKFGNARLDSYGYYRITSKKEGNHMKLLHRLIFEDFYNIQLPEGIVIHHDDENKTNNEIWNLIPMSAQEHMSLHSIDRVVSKETCKKISDSNKGHFVSEETKKKMSESHKGKRLSEETKNKLRIVNRGKNNGMYGKNHSEESKRKISQNRKGIYHSLSARIEMSRKNNKTGFYGVSQKIDKKYPDYIIWTYSITHNGKQIRFSRKNFLDLKEKVETENLPWVVLDEKKAKKTLQIAGLIGGTYE